MSGGSTLSRKKTKKLKKNKLQNRAGSEAGTGTV